jgi:hypothetical protein
VKSHLRYGATETAFETVPFSVSELTKLPTFCGSGTIANPVQWRALRIFAVTVRESIDAAFTAVSQLFRHMPRCESHIFAVAQR